MERKKKNQLVNALMAKAGCYGNKADILEGYGVRSTIDLSDTDIEALIKRLLQIVNAHDAGRDNELRKWRSNVLTQLQELGIYADKNSWSAVNKYLLNKRICGKLLYECTLSELKYLYRKLLIIKNKQKEADEKLMRESILN